MSAEDLSPVTKEAALAQLENVLRGDSEDNPIYDSGDLVNNAYKLVRELGASDYEVKRVEFLVEPPEHRQSLLNLEARTDFKGRVDSLEHGAELLRAYERIRVDFDLKDPYINRTS